MYGSFTRLRGCPPFKTASLSFFYGEGFPPLPSVRCSCGRRIRARLSCHVLRCVCRGNQSLVRENGKQADRSAPPICRPPLRALPRRGGVKLRLLRCCGPVRFGSVRFCYVRFCSVRFGSVRFCSVRFDSIRFHSVPLGSDCPPFAAEPCPGACHI